MKVALLKVVVAAVVGAALLGGCAGVRDAQGRGRSTRSWPSAIQAGVDNKESVDKTARPADLHRPVQRPTTGIMCRATPSQFAFRNPQGARSQTVLRVRFDQAGNVIVVRPTGKELIASDRPRRPQDPDARAASAASSTSCSATSARSAQPGAARQRSSSKPAASSHAGFRLSRRA